MPPSDFSNWVMENRGLLYYLQTFVDMRRDALTPLSFVTLVNSALIYRIDAAFAELAADGLRRVKHQLRNIKSESEAFHLLSGLATVAAVTRSHGLAEEVRVLMRVVRRKPGIQITQENAMRISMVAAAAHADRTKWCKYVGECITEFSFEETARRDALALRHNLLVLRQLEPQLWVTTGRADAAISAFLQSHSIASNATTRLNMITCCANGGAPNSSKLQLFRSVTDQIPIKAD